MKKILIVLLITLVFTSLVFGERNIDSKRALNKTAVAQSDVRMEVNRLATWFRNNSVFAYNYLTADWGSEWPIGSGLSPFYAAGMWVGAKYGDQVRVAATQHDATEFQPGQVIESGVAANRLDPDYRWFTIQPGGVGDWDTWPVEQGAPVDEDGEPVLIGDETSFCVFNDLGPHNTFQSNKLSVEIQQTIFAFNRADAIGDMNFMKWIIVNKSDTDWDSTYLSIWGDPDIGYGYEDLVGCDSALGLGYCYNGTNDDQNYGAAPPASGFDFFQGPIIDEVGSVVELPNGTVLNDKKMLGMTGFIFYDNNASIYGNPYNSNDVWNYMTSHWKDGSLITNDGLRGQTANGPPATYMFNGDPETGAGWLDSNEDDRRFLMTVGPFTMPQWVDTDDDGIAEFGEPGVQEVVAGLLVARGTSNVNSVTMLKQIDELAQLAYDIDFNLSVSPREVVVEVAETPNTIILTWGEESEYNIEGGLYSSIDPVVAGLLGTPIIVNNIEYDVDDFDYNFYGYAVYQYADASGRDPAFVAEWNNGGLAANEPYEGPHELRITQNYHVGVGDVGAPLSNGKTYHFGVQAYGYLQYGSPQFLASPVLPLPNGTSIVSVTPQTTPGVRYGAEYNDEIEIVHTTGEGLALADIDRMVRVVDPTTVTGHNYKVWFNSQDYYRDADGNWQFALDNTRMLNKSTDVSGSTLSVTALVAAPPPASPGAVQLEFLLHADSPNGAWMDGVELTFPAGITIAQADDIDHTNGYGDPVDAVVNGQTVTWGGNYLTEWGNFAGGEHMTVWVEAFTPPLDIEFLIWDDGYAPGATGIVDAVGVATVTELSYATETRNHWNVRDMVTGLDVLEDRDMLPDNTADPIVDGLQIQVSGGFDAPTDYIGVSGWPGAAPPAGTLTNIYGDTPGTYTMLSYGSAGWSLDPHTDWAHAYYAYDDGSGVPGHGTLDPALLTHDYELRFNGVYEDTNAVVQYVTEGTGQIATIYGARMYDLADHPMNPNPGSDDAFNVRVPFEVWNVTTGEQINIFIYDREGTPADDPFRAYNHGARMYCFFCNSPYEERVLDINGADGDNMTWNFVTRAADYTLGDVLAYNYANPINLGQDALDFTTAGLEPVTTAETLEDDVDNINVVPNPYYGYHSGEMNPFDRWVQFTNLPQTCTVRIFDLSGTLVRILEKDDDTTFMQWSLTNEYNIPVASGVYVYHVETENGDKVGKMALFMPNERIDTF